MHTRIFAKNEIKFFFAKK